MVNLFAFEAAYNPDGTDVDSNLYSVLALNTNTAIVVDAGGNDLLRIDNKGNVEVMAIFPTKPESTQDHKDLAGCPGSQADLCNLPPTLPTQPVPTTVVKGPNGYFYVAEMDVNGCFAVEVFGQIAGGVIKACDPKNLECVVVTGDIPLLTDIPFDEKGRLYATKNPLIPGLAGVVEIPL